MNQSTLTTLKTVSRLLVDLSDEPEIQETLGARGLRRTAADLAKVAEDAEHQHLLKCMQGDLVHVGTLADVVERARFLVETQGWRRELSAPLLSVNYTAFNMVDDPTPLVEETYDDPQIWAQAKGDYCKQYGLTSPSPSWERLQAAVQRDWYIRAKAHDG